MRKLKVSLSAMALLLGIGAALATTPARNLEDKRWGLNRSSGMYEDITGQNPGTIGHPVDPECKPFFWTPQAKSHVALAFFFPKEQEPTPIQAAIRSQVQYYYINKF